jgi:hypothetical protein
MKVWNNAVNSSKAKDGQVVVEGASRPVWTGARKATPQKVKTQEQSRQPAESKG